MANSVFFSKEEFRKKIRQYGLADDRVEEVTKLFERSNRHMDVVSFVILLERYGMARGLISDFLKDAGVDDITVINVFVKADSKKTEGGSLDITHIVLDKG